MIRNFHKTLISKYCCPVIDKVKKFLIIDTVSNNPEEFWHRSGEDFNFIVEFLFQQKLFIVTDSC